MHHLLVLHTHASLHTPACLCKLASAPAVAVCARYNGMQRRLHAYACDLHSLHAAVGYVTSFVPLVSIHTYLWF